MTLIGPRELAQASTSTSATIICSIINPSADTSKPPPHYLPTYPRQSLPAPHSCPRALAHARVSSCTKSLSPHTSPHLPQISLPLDSHKPSVKLAWFWTSSSPSSPDPTVSPPPPRPSQAGKRASSLGLVMSQPPPAPPLTPTLCFTPSALLTFLRTSRSLIDDSISTNLNALSTPSTTVPFSPTSTTIRQPLPNQRPIPQSSCQSFVNDVLFPTWHTRTQTLSYCAAVANSPDPDDPDAVQREAYNLAGEARVEQKNERLDPYSGRFFKRESRSEELAELVAREARVEEIVRERSWEAVTSRCGGLPGAQRAWEGAFKRWEEEGKRR